MAISQSVLDVLKTMGVSEADANKRFNDPAFVGVGSTDNSTAESVQVNSKRIASWSPGVRDIYLGFANASRDLASITTRPFDSSVADELNRMSNESEQAAAQADKGGATPEWLTQGIRGTTRSLATAVPLAPTGPYGMAGAFGAIRGNQALTEATNAGLSGSDRWKYAGRAAVIEGGISAIFTRAGAGGLEKIMGGQLGSATGAGVRAAFKRMGRGILEELPEEIATELADNLNQAYSNVDPNATSRENMLETMKQTAIQTIMSVGLASGAHSIKNQGAMKHRDEAITGASERTGLPEDKVRRAFETALESHGKGKDFDTAFGRELETASMVTSEGAAQWAASNPGAADGLQPSRKAFKEAGLPEMPGNMRKEFVQHLQGLKDVKLVDENGVPLPPKESPLKAREAQPAPTDAQGVETPVEAQESTPRTPFEQQSVIDRAELAGTTITPDNMDAVAEKMRSGAMDTTTGLLEGRVGDTRNRVAKRAQEHVAETGENAHYVLADVKNLGGLNSAMGDVEANTVFKQLASIFHEELKMPDVDVHAFRHGGDEVSAVVVNASDEAIKTAMHIMEKRAGEYVTSHPGLADIPHPKYKDDLTRRGTGLTIRAERITPDRTIEQIFASTGKDLERAKKGDIQNGIERTAGKIGLGASDGQAGRTIRGIGQADRGGERKVSESNQFRNEHVDTGREGQGGQDLRSTASAESVTKPDFASMDRKELNAAAKELGINPMGITDAGVVKRVEAAWAKKQGEIVAPVEVSKENTDTVPGFKSDKSTAASKGAEVYHYAADAPADSIPTTSPDVKAPNPQIFGMHDMLELLRRSGGKIPKILEALSKKNASGLFRTKTGGIDLKADIFIGPIIDTGIVKKAEGERVQAGMMKSILEQHPELKPEDIVAKVQSIGQGKARLTFYKKDESFARRVLAHEIGHWADYMPDETMARGNILGRLAKLKGFLKGETPDGIFFNKETRDELKVLSQWWKPFDVNADAKYTKYRHSSEELFADAISVLLNNPAALQKRAPSFRDAFFQYLDRNPEVNRAYSDICNSIKSGGSENKALLRIYDGYAEGDLAHKTALEKLNGARLTIMDGLGTALGDKWWKRNRLLALAKKRGMNTIDPRDASDAFNYAGANAEGYVNRMRNDVFNPLEKSNLTNEDLGVYLQLLRALNERKELANPTVGDQQAARKTLEQFTKNMGPERMAALEEARKARWEIRKEYVLNAAERSGLYDNETMDMLRNNEHYATVEVIDYIDSKMGSGSGVQLLGQVGTLKDASNPVSATMATDLSMMRGILHNSAKKADVDFFKQIGDAVPAEKRFNGKFHEFVETTEPGRALITFMHDGKQEGYYIDKTTADAHKNGLSEEMHTAINILQSVMNPVRQWYTVSRPGFQMANIIKDLLRTFTNAPDAWKHAPEFLGNWINSVHAGLENAKSGKLDKVTEEMLKKGLLVSKGNFQGAENYKTQIERLEAQHQGETWNEEYSNRIKKWYGQAVILMSLGERATKRASYMYLKNHQAELSYERGGPKGLTDIEVNRMVRHELGSPSFLTKGSMTPITNSIFMFSNVQKEGIRGDLAAFKRNPVGVGLRRITTSVAPKLLMVSLSTGMVGAALKAAGLDEDNWLVKWAKAMQNAYARVSHYDMANYTIIPVGMQGNKAVVLRIPLDENDRMLSGIIYNMVRFDKEGIKDCLQNAAQYMGDQGPGITPAFMAMHQAFQYLTGTNPYDSFRQRNAVPDTEWKAGGMAANKKFGKWMWNQYGGSMIYKFRESDDAPSMLQKFLGFPVMGDTAGRFIKVTDAGLVEQAKADVEKVQSVQAKDILEIRDLVKQKREGKVPLTDDEQKRLMVSDYAKNYNKMLDVKTGDSVQRLLDLGKNPTEKKAILGSLDQSDPAVATASKDLFSSTIYGLATPYPTKTQKETLEAYRVRIAKHDQHLKDLTDTLAASGVSREDAIQALNKEGRRRGLNIGAESFAKRRAMIIQGYNK